MQQLKFIPDDVLFLKDGRPMEASISGSGNHFPNPHIVHSALLAALHRALGVAETQQPRFGSLQTAGPFVIREADEEWLFPRPADLASDSTLIQLFPSKGAMETASSVGTSSRLAPLLSTASATKEQPSEWITKSAYNAYLQGKVDSNEDGFVPSESLFSPDHTIGIALEEATGTTRSGAFYSATRLRLKEGISLGVLAECIETSSDGSVCDLIEDLFPKDGRIRIGGENRVCKVRADSINSSKLPVSTTVEGNLIKWVLLTPAIFPNSSPGEGGQGALHPGGWLPGWIDPEDYSVLLKSEVPERQQGESRVNWRKRVQTSSTLDAKLVAAAIGRPIPITGWKLPNGDDGRQGARSTLLAVPAGSIYYFEAASCEAARALASALSWHGNKDGNQILHRRSTLFGEKGFGLGVCAPWSWHSGF